MANDFKTAADQLRIAYKAGVKKVYESLHGVVSDAMKQLPWLKRVEFQTSPMYDDERHTAIDFTGDDVEVMLWYAKTRKFGDYDDLRISYGSLYTSNYDDEYDPDHGLSDEDIAEFNKHLSPLFKQLDQETVNLLFGYASTVHFTANGIRVDGELDYDATQFRWSY